jgi:hypothetical protein
MDDDHPYREPAVPPTSPRQPGPEPPAKLAWYDQVWLALPFGLVAVGGAIGGMCGGAAWALNQKVFRATKHSVLRYVLTGLISLAAVIAYLILAMVFLAMLRRNG